MVKNKSFQFLGLVWSLGSQVMPAGRADAFNKFSFRNFIINNALGCFFFKTVF